MAEINPACCLITKFEDEQKIKSDEGDQGLRVFDIFIEDSSVTVARLIFTDR